MIFYMKNRELEQFNEDPAGSWREQPKKIKMHHILIS